MGKNVFLGIVDFIMTRNEKDKIELKILEMGPFDTSNFSAINNEYSKADRPVMLRKVLETLSQHFDAVYYDRGPFTRLNSHKDWMSNDVCSGEPMGWLAVLEDLAREFPKLQRYRNNNTCQNSLVWLFPLSEASDGQCYNKAYLMHQKFKRKNVAKSVLMAPLGSVAMARNKGILKRILETSSSSLSPQTLLIDLVKYDDNQLRQFLAQTDTTYFILKPTNSTLSNGVFIAKKEDILLAIAAIANKDSKQLMELLKKYNTPENFSKNNSAVENKLENILNYWQQSTDGFILVQSYCFAAPIIYDNKQYFSSKGRAVILVIDDKVYVIDIYFHAPVHQESEQDKFTYKQCVVGGNVSTIYFNPPSTIYASLQSILEKELPNIFANSFAYDLQNALLEAIEQKDESSIRYLLTSCSTLPLGKYRENFLIQIKKNVSTSARNLYYLDFLVTQVAKYFLGNEERQEYRPLFDILMPNIFLLNFSQLKQLLNYESFVLRDEATEEFKTFFNKLNDLMEKAKLPPIFSLINLKEVKAVVDANEKTIKSEITQKVCSPSHL